MIRGISFELPENMVTNVLPHILGDIDIKAYEWINHLDQFERYCCYQDCGFHAKEIYKGQELFSVVDDNEYIIFIKLQAFVNSYKAMNCHTYEQFIQSDCEMLVLIYDVYYVDIYLKSMDILDEVKNNAFKNGFINITIITDENDNRTKLDVI